MPADPRPLRILAKPRNRDPDAPELACIRCGACQSACPEGLVPEELYWYAREGAWPEAAERGLDRCIECGLCNQVCPSNIDLLAAFTRGRQALAAAEAAERDAQEAKRRYQRHLERKAARQREWEARRQARLAARDERPWLR
ncbi:MAG TPA: 4Fe-4S dicluster domain-containing protein [Pseudomonadales bacterium]